MRIICRSNLENNRKVLQSRANKILTLALNKELKSKIVAKKKQYSCQKNIKQDIDPDYKPRSNEASSESDEENDCGRINNSQKKIVVISCVVIPPTATCKTNLLLNPNAVENNINADEPLKLHDLTECEFFVKEILNTILERVLEISVQKNYTKAGNLRKRKIYDFPLSERKKQKLEKYIQDHNVKQSCHCKLKCREKISVDRQNSINEQYWQLSKEQQKLYLFNCIKKTETKKKTTRHDRKSRRVNSFQYYLKSDKGETQRVCKIFLLGTLGFQKENDRVLKNIRSTDVKNITPKPDRRKHPSTKKIDRISIIEHINSFRPTLAHYRREHAPNRKYLPSDINITMMYADFREKFPNQEFSYELYRKVVSDLNISFTKLGHEECWQCEAYEIHKKCLNHDGDIDSHFDCEICKKWKLHITKANNAREEYRRDAEKNNDSQNELFVSADLQKVIFLEKIRIFS